MANEIPKSSWQSILTSTQNLQIAIITVLILAVVTFFIQQKPGQDYNALFEDYRPSTSEFNRILIAFGQSNLNSYRVENGRILVPPKEKPKYLASIQEHDALPSVLQISKETQPNPFLPKSQQRLLRFNQKKRKVRDMIVRLSFVKEAWLEVDWSESDSFYHQAKHSAVVMVSVDDHQALNKQQVSTIQELVSGAFSRIANHDVVVTDANMGISYHDLTDNEQVELIELVSWKMKRKLHYLEQLATLKREIPGLKIEIDVRKPNQLKPAKPTPNVAVQPPAKLAVYEHELKLNSSGQVRNEDIARRIPTTTFQDENVIARSSLKKPAIDTTFSSVEIVDVHLRVPTHIARQMSLADPDHSEDESASLTRLKTKLEYRVRSSLPELTKANGLNVIVSLIPDPSEDTATAQSAIQEAIKIYWPILAVVLIGLFSLVINRRNSSEPVSEAVSQASPEPIAPHELESQLTSLIDNNPEAAAKVIKNWIRDAT